MNMSMDHRFEPQEGAHSPRLASGFFDSEGTVFFDKLSTGKGGKMSGIGSTEFAARTTVEIMRLLADLEHPLSVRDVARALDLKCDTARCYLAALENEKFVKAVDNGFELGDSPAIWWDRYKADLESRIGICEKN
jgi:hypothetical protein